MARKFLIRVGPGLAATPVILILAASVCGQQTNPAREIASPTQIEDSVRALRAQVQDLQTLLLQMRAEIDRAHAANLETGEKLRLVQERLDAMGRVSRDPVLPVSPGGSVKSPQTAPIGNQIPENIEDRVSKMEEDQQLLTHKIDEQYQTKVESASKYRVRLSGIALLNLFSNQGAVDNLDFPALASPRAPLNSSGSVGATMRQSEVGLEVFGPDVHGAKISADMEMDFSGEYPSTPNGVNSGLFRLRTAALHVDWGRTSVIAGQDRLFISPLSPTSLATLAVPSFAYAGNLWAWTPQLRVEHHMDISENSGLVLQGGILDPLDGELPQDEFARFPQAGEKSRQPAYGTRIAWSRKVSDRTLTLGAGGYYSRQNWGFNRNVDSWAGTSDLQVPLATWLVLSAEFYRGRGIGGLGAGLGRSAVWSGPLSDPRTAVYGLDVIGGWSQLKFKPTARWEFNGAFGQDSSEAGEVRRFPGAPSYFDPSLVRNRSWFGNIVYQPHSDLLFSIEYRRLRTFSINGTSEQANHVNLAMGILF